MTGQRDTGPIPWRVKTRVGRATWFGPAMTEAEAVHAAAAEAEAVRCIGDGGRMLAVPTRYGVVAWVRGRDVVSIEPVGPRWDGVDDNDRPDVVPSGPDGIPGKPDEPTPPALVAVPVAQQADVSDGTAWLRDRELKAASRKRVQR